MTGVRPVAFCITLHHSVTQRVDSRGDKLWAQIPNITFLVQVVSRSKAIGIKFVQSSIEVDAFYDLIRLVLGVRDDDTFRWSIGKMHIVIKSRVNSCGLCPLAIRSIVFCCKYIGIT